MVISGLDEGFLYVTFDIIRERVIEVKEFGACAVGSFLICHCAFIIGHLSLHIGDDIYGITSSKSAIRITPMRLTPQKVLFSFRGRVAIRHPGQVP